MCVLYDQRVATYTMFFVIISALHVSGGFSAHHQELKKCMCSLGYCHAFLLSTGSMFGVEPQTYYRITTLSVAMRSDDWQTLSGPTY
jgi:hypothetical protein